MSFFNKLYDFLFPHSGEMERITSQLRNNLSEIGNIIQQLEKDNKSLQDKIANLRRELTFACQNNATRNKELDALHYVWCDGGCQTGVHRYCGSPEEITEEVVQLAERNTKRLRDWYESNNLKKTYRK